MPEYPGPVSYIVDVVGHLLRHYAVWMFVGAVVLPAPFAIWGALAVGVQDGVLPWLRLSLGMPVWWFGVSHWVTFAALPFYVDARFPYVSPYLTLSIAGLVGATLLSAAWTLFDVASADNTLLNRFQWIGLGTISAAAFGAAVMKFGGTGGLHFGLGRWVGWLVVGHRAFEAFLAKDAVRLKREYDDYSGSFRR